VSRLGDPSGFLACHEAGPTGYDTHPLFTCSESHATGWLLPSCRRAHASGSRPIVWMLVTSPACPGARHHPGPSPAEEALRDLIRVREDLKTDRRRATQRLKALLLRVGRRFPGRDTGWSLAYDTWVKAQRFPEPAAQATFDHYPMARAARTQQLEAVDREIEQAAILPNASGPRGQAPVSSRHRSPPPPSRPRSATSVGSRWLRRSCLSPAWCL
jgi:transposase